MFRSVKIISISAFAVWLQYGIRGASLFASISIIICFILRGVARLVYEPKTAKQTHRGVRINGEHHPPGTYNLNGGVVRCGKNGSVTVKGDKNVGNTVISG